MVKEIIFGTAGGLGLFMFGMVLMSEGLKKAAGQKMKNILGSMTKRRIAAFGVGAGVTALIQSSSAATVMVVGFVNAGMLTLEQAISVIIGTNVGTTATAWLVSISGFEGFKITNYALPAIAVGFAMEFFGKRRMIKEVGQVILGFGILFIGINFMKEAFSGLERTQGVQTLFVGIADRPLLAMLAGAIVTMLIQSSSAAVASIQLMAVGGAFGSNWDIALNVSIPFILGSNIGTTITAQIAAIGTNLNARRSAWAHTMFNVIGAFICFWFIAWIAKMVNIIIPWELGPATIAVSIAVAHSSIKIFEAVLFLPMTKMLEKIVVLMIREKPGEEEARPVILEEHLLNTPVIAIQQTKLEIVRMAEAAKKAFTHAVDSIISDDRKKLKSVRQIEDFIDEFQLEITSYLSALVIKNLSDNLSIKLPVLLHTVNDLERIGDHALNIAEIAERKIDNKLLFSEAALAEADQMRKEADQMFDCIISALENDDTEAARSAIVNENNLNRMQIDFRRSHVKRMTDAVCTPQTGLIFIDLVDNIEKIGDHLTNIAQAVVGGLQWEGVEPKISPSP
jgi:phosphate:Na+ symporter